MVVDQNEDDGRNMDGPFGWHDCTVHVRSWWVPDPDGNPVCELCWANRPGA